jgi:hypothetical protein
LRTIWVIFLLEQSLFQRPTNWTALFCIAICYLEQSYSTRVHLFDLLGFLNNLLTGTIPVRLGVLTDLTGLYLQTNLLSGQFLFSRSLTFLDLGLHTNLLTETIHQ